jgi:hypothetical protein
MKVPYLPVYHHTQSPIRTEALVTWSQICQGFIAFLGSIELTEKSSSFMITVLAVTASTGRGFSASRTMETDVRFTAVLDLVLATNAIKTIGTDTVFKIRMSIIKEIHDVIRKLLVDLLQILSALLAGTTMHTRQITFCVVRAVYAILKSASRPGETFWTLAWPMPVFWA